MPQTALWNISEIKQCKLQTGQAMLSDEHTLAFFSRDFGHLFRSKPSVVCLPKTPVQIQNILHYANEHQLPLTIRGKGMSQCGQSLAPTGGLILSMKAMNAVTATGDNHIWVESNTTWAKLLKVTLAAGKIPPVVPYNCNLSVGGVISAGGVGASSFKYGAIVSHVKALDIITARGELQQVDKSSPLFHACLGGQGRFALIHRICLELVPCKKMVRTFYLAYSDKESCLQDLREFRKKADFVEFFCTPSLQGAKLSGSTRKPFALWIYALHISVQFEDNPPSLQNLAPKALPWKSFDFQDETITSYMHRHDSRFQAMKLSGQWRMRHPWYECFISQEVLIGNLDEILISLPIFYATVLQIVPIAKIPQTGFLKLPIEDSIFAMMILNPGLPKAFVPAAMETIQKLDERLLPLGSKRYLSGYVGEGVSDTYWKGHFDRQYEDWMEWKKVYDPEGIFCSVLYGRR